MKVAFVGKGGSGKSTLAALFIQNLRKENEKILSIDADINQHLAGLIGAKLDSRKAISKEKNASDIKEYLIGENNLIDSPSHMYKTTPPGKGSNLVHLAEDNKIIQDYAEKLEDDTYFMHVGTYEREGIGTSCYHTDLAVFENILSHTVLDKEWLVADMVAGTDAFSNTLHAQFDAIFFIIEPTPEGIEVYNQYRELSEEAGIRENVYLIGNKVMDEEDKNYLKQSIEEDFIGFLDFKKEIKKSRQRNRTVKPELLENKLFEKIRELSEKAGMTDKERLNRLHNLHRKYVNQDYVKNAVGDITNQIDQGFKYESDA